MMRLIEQLARYHRRSQPAEVPQCRLWLPQGEARIAYLRELLEPETKQPAERG
jgi:hypothetical protein